MRKADEKKQELRKAVRIRRHMPVRAWIAEWMTTYKEPNVSEKTYQDYNNKHSLILMVNKLVKTF